MFTTHNNIVSTWLYYNIKKYNITMNEINNIISH